MKMIIADNQQFYYCFHWRQIEEMLELLYIGEINELELRFEESDYFLLHCQWDEGESFDLKMLLVHDGQWQIYRLFDETIADVTAWFRQYYEHETLDLNAWFFIKEGDEPLVHLRRSLTLNMDANYLINNRLRSVVNKQLNRAVYTPVKTADLLQLEELSCTDSDNIPDLYLGKTSVEISLTALAYAVILRYLDLSGSKFSHTDALLCCPNIATLILDRTRITNLWFIRQMKQLRKLSIRDCVYLTDVDVLLGLNNLCEISVDQKTLNRLQLQEKLPHVVFDVK